MQSVGSPS
jgi:hypothetical protein